MDYKDAYNKANIGDELICGMVKVTKTAPNEPVALIDIHIAADPDWEIKPKQQKFLTPGKWLRDQYPEKYSGEYIQTGGYHDACMHFAFESGEKQGIKKGRLERDQELRPAIDLARKVKKLYWELKNHLIFATLGMQDLFESKLQQLDDELNNLKPVNGNE